MITRRGIITPTDTTPKTTPLLMTAFAPSVMYPDNSAVITPRPTYNP